MHLRNFCPFAPHSFSFLNQNKILTSQMLAKWKHRVLVGNAALLLPIRNVGGSNLWTPTILWPTKPGKALLNLYPTAQQLTCCAGQTAFSHVLSHWPCKEGSNTNNQFERWGDWSIETNMPQIIQPVKNASKSHTSVHCPWTLCSRHSASVLQAPLPFIFWDWVVTSSLGLCICSSRPHPSISVPSFMDFQSLP